jgi:hypothetical protein
MKNIHTSDMNPMVPFILNHASARLTTPVSTSEIWGKQAFSGASALIWTAPTAISGTNATQECNAIWGTCGRSAPLQPVGLPFVEMHC